MATFTTLDDADLAAIAAAFGLGALRRWRPIAAGTINSNFDVEAAAGRFFVRVNEGKTVADVVWEGELVAALAARGVPAPVPLPVGDARHLVHRDLLISAFAWRAGGHRAAAEVSVGDAGRVGEVLARLHLAGLDLPPAVRRRSIYDHAHLRARFAALPGDAVAADPALADAVALLGDELAWLDARADARAAATAGLIHGDLFRDNVLFEGDDLVAVLDFEQASGGSLAYDLAVCLNDWAWAGGPRPDVARALVAGYQRVRPLTAADRAALPIELRAAAARFTLTRITDVHLPGISNPDKDFRDFLARLARWRTAPLPDLATSV
ncbi:MAG: homoserine kinase [Kofleriaceae bacterium]|nr:homoserine kinase [Kofleriaceae bacterium]